jgi:hypothetical protein
LQRKTSICSRCQRVMYPGGIGDPRNHKRDHCDDGVTAKLAIPFPQPAGVFTKGKHINAGEFRSALHRVVSLAIDYHSGSKAVDLTMADLSFIQLLFDRLRDATEGEEGLFDLTGLVWSPAIQSQVRVINGKAFLTVDMTDRAPQNMTSH